MTIEFGDKSELKKRLRNMKEGFYDYDFDCGHVKINRATSECTVFQGGIGQRGGVLIQGAPGEFASLREGKYPHRNSIIDWNEIEMMVDLAPHVPLS